jgi:hypothetical protein
MAQKITTLSPVHINTKYDKAYLDAGMAGVKLINPSSSEGLETYHNLSELITKYGTDNPIYKIGAAYFSNNKSPLFQILNYVAGQTDKLADGSSESSLTHMLTKYFDSGSQYFLMKSDGQNINDVMEASNFIEAQDSKELIVDAVTPDDTPDLSALKVLAGNKATYVTSLPMYNGKDQQLGAAFLAAYANAPVGQEPTFVTDLMNGINSEVVPQDMYEFSAAKNAQYYAKYGVATYANRGGNNMMTSSKSQSGDQFQIMTVRDAITNEITQGILNIFMKNPRVPYDETGINLFDGAIRVVLKKYVEQGLIENNFTVDSVNSNDISDNIKASGKLKGMAWKYTPVFNINDATFSQTIVLPEQ